MSGDEFVAIQEIWTKNPSGYSLWANGECIQAWKACEPPFVLSNICTVPEYRTMKEETEK